MPITEEAIASAPAEATRKLMKMVGEPVTENTKADFIERLRATISEGADVNAPLPANNERIEGENDYEFCSRRGRGTVIKGETSLDYYLRRERIHHYAFEQQRDSEEGGASSESLYATNAEIAKEIADVLKDSGGKTTRELRGDDPYLYKRQEIINRVKEEISKPEFFGKHPPERVSDFPPPLDKELFPDTPLPDSNALDGTRRSTVRDLFNGALLASMETRLAEIIALQARLLPGEGIAPSLAGNESKEKQVFDMARKAAEAVDLEWNEQSNRNFKDTAEAHRQWVDNRIRHELTGKWGIETGIERQAGSAEGTSPRPHLLPEGVTGRGGGPLSAVASWE